MEYLGKCIKDLSNLEKKINGHINYADLGNSVRMRIEANGPDEEDLTSTSNKLKFKDRGAIDGMGYVILRKGTDSSMLFPNENTIYEIRYDFDLLGESIEIPDGSMLVFNGGRLLNGSVEFRNTCIKTGYYGIFSNVEICGTITNTDIYAAWFEYDGGHDDFGMLKCLCENSARIHLGGKSLSADKSLHANKYIKIGSNTVIDGEGATISANHSAGGWDALFEVAEAINVEFKNFTVACELGVYLDPPIDHDGEQIFTSGIYAIYVNNKCSNLRISNMAFNNVGCALKTSRYTAYAGPYYFEDITVDNCYVYGDMPIQGAKFANFVCNNCKLISRGTNSGNHAVYMLSTTDYDYEGIDRSIYFNDCYLHSEDGDGQVIQIYATGDDGEESMNKCYFTNCVISSAGSSAITCSQSADIYLCNCDLRAASCANCNPHGKIYYYQCSIKNYLFYGNVSIKDSKVTTEAAQLITGIDEIEGSIELVNNVIVCDNYFIYNNIDNVDISVKYCDITVKGDGLISQRKDQIVPLVFENCKIRVKSRVCYCPGKTTSNTFTFVMCDMSSSNPLYFFTTNSDDNIQLEFQACLFDGDMLHSPKSQINAGSTRPTNALRLGQTFFDSTLGKMIVWNGSEWINVDGTALS